ncbi:MAG: hypothetical protein QOG73_636 [Acetobacteraceae bacterium]|nr:hypothetical protein [Acetobacteraceae bacterium]
MLYRAHAPAAVRVGLETSLRANFLMGVLRQRRLPVAGVAAFSG